MRKKPLVLKTETLRKLTQKDLKQAWGGATSLNSIERCSSVSMDGCDDRYGFLFCE
jgi:hypothetical protein